jgi:hypothetical protein
LFIVGKFNIETSFKITGRGLVAVGDLLEGWVRVGSVVTVDAGDTRITFTISGVERGRKSDRTVDFVGLRFAYQDDQDRLYQESLTLPPQVVDILDTEAFRPKDMEC